MKRFTETSKWDDPWFMDLPVKYKVFWLYICDRCDNAGAWEPNMRLAATQIGEPLELVEILRVFSGRIQQLKDGKLFIEKFISFQYGRLSPNCRAHIPLLNSIEKLRVSNGYPIPIHRDMVKVKVKVKDKEGECEGKQKSNGKQKPKDQAEVEDFTASLGLPRSDGEAMWLDWQERGYGKTKDWKAKIRKWKSFSYLPSQKQRRNQKVSSEDQEYEQFQEQWRKQKNEQK